MRSFLKRLYPAILVAVIFVVVGVIFDGSLDTIDYVVTYIVFGFFYLPILLEKSIWEMIEVSRPRFIKNLVLARKRKYLEKRPLNPDRIRASFLIILFLLFLLWFPIAESLSEAASAKREPLSDSIVVDRLFFRASIFLSIVVVLILLAGNLMRRYYVDWNIQMRSELSDELPGCTHFVNIFILIVLASMLLISSRSSQFISGNFGSSFLLITQGFIALMLSLGERLLRNRR